MPDPRWAALGMGRQPAPGPQMPALDMEGFLERLSGLVQGVGPSLASRMQDLSRMQRERFAAGEGGPAMPGSPEAELGLDVASNFDFTGALGGPVRGEVLRDLGEMSGPGGGGGGMSMLAPPRMPAFTPVPRAPETYTPVIEPMKGGKEGKALENVLRQPEGEMWTPGDLFDYSRLGELPPTEQFPLARMPEPPKGYPDYLTKVADPKNKKRVQKLVEDGTKLGGMEWYNTEPLRKAFIGELGEEEGNAAHRLFAQMIAASSPQNKVTTNVKNASYYFQRARSGLDPVMIDPVNKGVFRDPKTGVEKPTNLFLPPFMPGYGHKIAASHVGNVQDLLSQGFLNPLTNPKIASFAENISGNQFPLTVDVHNLRALQLKTKGGQPIESPDPQHYAYLEQLQQDWAKEMGMTPAQFQANMWLGGAGETNMSSPVEPLLRTFERRVEYTAGQRGQKKSEVLRDFLRGKAPLLGVGPMAGMMYRSLLPEDVEADDDLDNDGT